MRVKILAVFNTLEELKASLDGILKTIENSPEDFTRLEYRSADKTVTVDDLPLSESAVFSCRYP